MAGRSRRRAFVAAVLGVGLVGGVALVAAQPSAAGPRVPRPTGAVAHGGPATGAVCGGLADRVVALAAAQPVPVRASGLPVAPAAAVANPRTAWGPSLATVQQARAAVRDMPLDVLAGQVLVAGYPGADPSVAASLVAAYHLGGVILMGGNVASLDQVRATAAAVQAAAAADGRDWPAVVAIDEEGGRVSRLRGLLPDLPPFATFGAADDGAATRERFARLGADLAALGITMDFAPVADVTVGAADPTIGDRSASGDPAVVARTVVAAGRGLLEGGTVPVLKHFPGHGSVTIDSHVGLPCQTATLEQLSARDLVPFQVAVDAGAPVVMMGHLDVVQLDPGVPSSLSPAAYGLLREGLGFDGVAVTDALDMGAVPTGAPGEEVVRALAAGADLVLKPRDVAAAHAAIVAAVQSGALPRERLEEAATRVVALQLWAS